MKEDRIIGILKREARNIAKTGKPPQEGALPKWLHYIDHGIQFSLKTTLSASAKMGHRVRVFFVEYDLATRRYKSFIDSVPYTET